MHDDIKKIVVPVDFTGLSEHAARYACALANSFGAHVYLIHVLEHQPLSEGVSSQASQDARVALDALAARLCPGKRVTTEVRSGKVAASINEAVTAYGADLVVMATNARTGLSHVIHGSVAESLIRKAAIPVLVLRDSGGVKVHPATRAA